MLVYQRVNLLKYQIFAKTQDLLGGFLGTQKFIHLVPKQSLVTLFLSVFVGQRVRLGLALNRRDSQGMDNMCCYEKKIDGFP
jgi:hypothetical protein